MDKVLCHVMPFDMKSYIRNKGKQKTVSTEEYMELLSRKLLSYYETVRSCNAKVPPGKRGHSRYSSWRIIDLETKEDADPHWAAIEWLRVWLFNHSKRFNGYPEDQRYEYIKETWNHFVRNYLKKTLWWCFEDPTNRACT